MADNLVQVVAKVVVAVQPTTKIGKPRDVKILNPRPIEGVKHGVVSRL